MASPDIFDLEALLQPISEAEPTGPELKDDPAHSAVYYAIKEARDAARAAERRQAQAALYGDEAEGNVTAAPNWKQVQDLAMHALAAKSKDLWIAAWLIEALTRTHGFAGLRDGFRLTQGLCERYWEGLHPRPDEDGVAHTVAQLIGLYGGESEGALVAPIMEIPITHGTATEPLSSSAYLQALKLEQITDPARKSQRIEQGALTMAQVEQAAQETPAAWYQTLWEDVDQCLEAFDSLNRVLDEKCGQGEDGYSAAPPASGLRGTLDECRDRIRSLARRVLADDAEEPAGAASTDLASVRGSAPLAGAGGKVVTRDDAFRALLQVAEFFRQTEPHSPVSYALEQAVRWGRMSLPQLMSELIADESVRSEIFRRVGIAPPTTNDNLS